ncbi:MAG: hypothetical protein KC656_01720 [Myxococcales bacterium]|nr:hypothetical protein [Myxococcales bacterium]
MLTDLGARPELAVALVAFPPVLFVSARGWSEGPWMVVWLAQAAVLASWSRTPDPRRLALAAALAGAGFWVRHAAVVGVLTLPLFVGMWRWGRRELVRDVGIAAGVSGSVAGAWVLLALWVGGTFGFRYPSTETPLTTTLGATWTALGGTFDWRGGADAVVLLLALVSIGLAARVRRPAAPAAGALGIWLVLQGLAALTAYLVTRWRHHLDDPDLRLLLPVTLPLFLVGVAWTGRRAPRATLMTALLWAGLQAGRATSDPQPRAYRWAEGATFRSLYRDVMVHSDPGDTVLAPLGMVVSQRTGRDVVTSLAAPYGAPMSDDEMARIVAGSAGRTILFAPRDEGWRDAFGPWWRDLLADRTPFVAERVAGSERFEVFVLSARPPRH